MNLHAEYPLFLIFPCILAGISVGYWLYRNNPLQLSSKYAKRFNLLLAILRATVISTLLILLVGPLIKWITYNVEKPVIVLALDQSRSMTHHNDSSMIKNELSAQLTKLTNQLEENFEVIPVGFGSALVPMKSNAFEEKKTNLSNALQEIQNTFGNSRLQGVVLVTDGIINAGEDPLQITPNFNYPIYTLATGDTLQEKDIQIKHVRYNKTVYAGNDFLIQVELGFTGINLKQTNVQITCDGQPLIEKSVSLGQSASFISIPVSLHAPAPGLHRYAIKVASFTGEKNIYNNQKSILVEVVKSRKNIAILALAPHPDIAAITACIKATDQYEVTLLSPESPIPTSEFNLVIAHQIPGNAGKGLTQLKQLLAHSRSLLLITGPQTAIPYLGDITENQLTILAGRMSSNEATAMLENNFTLFQTNSDELQKVISYPPMTVPYGDYRLPGDAQILFKQKIGNVPTEYPLWAFFKAYNKRTGYIAGDGFWKWYLQDAKGGNHPVTEQLIAQTLHYLTAEEQTSPFRISCQPIFESGEHILMNAELYDPSGMLTTDASPTIKINGEGGKSFEFGFSPDAGGFKLDAGILSPGEYSYAATAQLGNTVYKASGAFSVSNNILEYIKSVSDHQMLRELATSTEGSFYPINQIDQLIRLFEQNKSATKVIYKKEEQIPLISLNWILALIGSMMVTEWMIRKWNGSI